MYRVVLSINRIPILIDQDGREHIFNKNGEIIKIYEVGYYSPDELKKYGKPELKVNQFYYMDWKNDIEIVLSSDTKHYSINRRFREDYDKINEYKSVKYIRKYNLKTSQPILVEYLENFKIQKIKEIQHKKEEEKKAKVDEAIKNYTQQQSKERLHVLTEDYEHNKIMRKEDQRKQRAFNVLDKQLNPEMYQKHQEQLKPQQIYPINEIKFNLPFNQANNKTDWLKSSLPYRSPNKIKGLYFNKFGKKDISINDIKQNIEHYNNFNIKQNQKKFSLKTYSNIFHSFIGDIFFESNIAAFLLLININTRKAYAYQLGKIDCKDEIDLVNGVEKIVYQYAIGGKKTTTELIKAFNKHLLNEKINILKFDGESAIKSLEFQQFLKDHNIKFIKTTPNSHTSLSIIDRLCKTIREIAFNLRCEPILTQNQMNTILNYYNNMRHEGLTKILRKKVCPNDLSNNPDLEKQYVIECEKYNLAIMNQKDFELNNGDEVKIVNVGGKLNKKRSILSKDHYKVVGYNGNIVKLKNMKNGNIEYRPRFYIQLNGKRNQ